MKTSSAKQKARRLQNATAEQFLDAFPDFTPADIHPAIMGESGIDIHLSQEARLKIPFGIECKAQEALSIWAALEQAEKNAAKEHLWGCLVFKRNGSETYAALRLENLLVLLRNAQTKNTGGPSMKGVSRRKLLGRYRDELGFDPAWLCRIEKGPLEGKGCGIKAQKDLISVMHRLKQAGAIRRDHLTARRVALWSPGPEYAKWRDAAKTFEVTDGQQ
jgi:hypothetical protein